jgi:hypothetical protein
MRGKKSYLARGRRCLAASLAVLWQRPVAVSWLTDGGSQQRRYSFERRGYVFFKFFLPVCSFPFLYFGSSLFRFVLSSLWFLLFSLFFFLPFVFLSFVFLSSVFFVSSPFSSFVLSVLGFYL